MDNKLFVTRSSMPPYEEFIEAIKPLWDSHRLTNMGPYHNELQDRLRDFLGVDDLSLMVNGHMALEMGLQAFGFPEDGEIITTPFTFISTTHAIVRNRLRPVFCDVKLSDGTIDENLIEDLITDKTVAILPVHVYGNICNAEAIERIARSYNLKVIYDAAHAFGESFNGIGVGNLGDESVFSFHATKVFNTIEGGAVTFHDHWIYDKLYNLKNFGIHGETLVTEIGANAKMNELCAITGICNLSHIDEAFASRKRVFEKYLSAIEGIHGIDCIRIVKEGETNNYSYFPILVQDDYPITRDALYDKMREKDVYPRKYFYPITSDQNCFRNKYKNVNLINARYLSNRVLTLPIYEGLSDEDVDRVIDLLAN